MVSYLVISCGSQTLTSTRIGPALREKQYSNTPKEDTDGHDLLCRISPNEPATGVLSKEVPSVYHCKIRQYARYEKNRITCWQKGN